MNYKDYYLRLFLQPPLPNPESAADYANRSRFKTVVDPAISEREGQDTRNVNVIWLPLSEISGSATE